MPSTEPPTHSQEPTGTRPTAVIGHPKQNLNSVEPTQMRVRFSTLAQAILIMLDINYLRNFIRFFAGFRGIKRAVLQPASMASPSILKGLDHSAQDWPDSERGYLG
jgi:hypothetical protein